MYGFLGRSEYLSTYSIPWRFKQSSRCGFRRVKVCFVTMRCGKWLENYASPTSYFTRFPPLHFFIGHELGCRLRPCNRIDTGKEGFYYDHSGVSGEGNVSKERKPKTGSITMRFRAKIFMFLPRNAGYDSLPRPRIPKQVNNLGMAFASSCIR
jgi:hypothetical protein